MFSKLFSKKKQLDKLVHLPKDRFSFLQEEEQVHFQDMITRYFQDKPGFIISFSDGVVTDSEGMQYGLDNLAQMYHTAKKYDHANDKETQNIVADHFNSIFRSHNEEKEILKERLNYNAMKKYLSVRLYPPDYAASLGKEGLVSKEDLEGILTVVVLDLPSTVINVKPEDATNWNISIEELFKVGHKNAISNNTFEITQQKFADEAELWMIGSDSLFASANIYNLSKYPKMTGKYGSLVSIPHRHMTLVHPINNISTLSALNQLIFITSRAYEEGPGSISPNIYWYHKGKFTYLPYELDAKKLNFSPPNEFVEILNKLAEKEN